MVDSRSRRRGGGGERTTVGESGEQQNIKDSVDVA
jgi:hypothetical protein